MKEIEERYRKVIETEGWTIGDIDENGNVELSNEVPNGQEFSIVVSVDNIKKDIINYDYDYEEYVYEALKAKKEGIQGVPSVFILCENAQAFDEMLDDLSYSLIEADTINEYLG